MQDTRLLAEQDTSEAQTQQLADFDPIPFSREVCPSGFEDEDGDSFFFDFPFTPEENLDIPDVKPEEIDSMVAKEMASLSMQDREKVYSDVHGVSRTIEETPELLQTSLLELEVELDLLEDYHAYDIARKMDSAFVKNEAFRLMFLRADLFDAKKTAKRIGLFFKHKLDLFGKDHLTKSITQDCLDEESMRALYLGNFRLLEERDSAGRALLVNFLQPTDLSIDAKLRAVFYTIMLAVEDEETQRNGCVGISYLVGQNTTWLQLSPHRHQWNLRLGELSKAMPFRLDAMQICHDSFATRILIAVLKLGGAKDMRLRMREHFGTRQECLFSLQTFGIPTYCLPINRDGKIRTERLVEAMEKRRKLERSQQKESQKNPRIGIPRRNDVLFGRGKAYYRHIGNLRFRGMVEENSVAYEATNIAGKQQIRDGVIDAIRKAEGRFLRDDGAGWVEVPDSVAGKKVAHAFRTLRALKVNANTNDQTGGLSLESSTMKQSQTLKRSRLD